MASCSVESKIKDYNDYESAKIDCNYNKACTSIEHRNCDGETYSTCRGSLTDRDLTCSFVKGK